MTKRTLARTFYFATFGASLILLLWSADAAMSSHPVSGPLGWMCLAGAVASVATDVAMGGH